MQRYGPGLSRPSPDLNDADRSRRLDCAGAAQTDVRFSTAGHRGPPPLRYARDTTFIVASTGLGVVSASDLARATVAWGAELLAARSCTLAKQQLRAALLRHLAAIGLTRPGAQRTGEMTTL
jgi:hypothetical protein